MKPTKPTSSTPSGTVNSKRKASRGNKSASLNKSTGKKGKTSSSGKSDLEITEENMAFYKAMQAKLKAQEKAAASSQDEGKLF
jgi:hypothetical protein